jgi:hypothetical protein
VRIRPGIYSVEADDRVLLMDLQADRYLGLGPVSARIWSGLKRDRAFEAIAESLSEVLKDPGTSESRLEIVDRQVEVWRKRALVVPVDASTWVDRTDLPTPREGARATRAIDARRVAATRLSARCVVQVLRAAAVGRMLMRAFGLPFALRRLQMLNVERSQPENEERLLRVLRAHRWLRRAEGQGREDCLRRSFTLAWALRRQGIDASVAIGARSDPFAAHAWVEANGAVVNERMDGVASYAILASF